MLSSAYGKPQNFKEALHNKDTEERQVWHTLIQKELKDIISDGV